jgi:cytoskeleton protein RodZ
VDAALDSAQPRSPGRILAAERERQGLGPADVAQRLHMSVGQVEALERDEYAKLPRGPFLRGFLRNYAKLLGLPPDDLLALLAEGAPRDPAPRIVVPSQNIRFDPLAERISSPYVRAAVTAAVVIAFAFAAMYWWAFIRTAPPAAVARKTPSLESAPVPRAPKPATPVPAPPLESTARPPAEAAMAEVPQAAAPRESVRAGASRAAEPPKPAAVSQVAAVPAAMPPKPPQDAAGNGGGTIKLRFKGKSWVEVKDARGRILLTGLNDPGSETEVSGQPPFRVVVGNAPEVQVFFNDRQLDLEPHMREAVARMTVE